MNRICEEIRKIILNNLSEITSCRHTGRLKQDNTFVSDGDLLCERLIADYIHTFYPEALLITEESYRDILKIKQSSAIVTVDPIDGTENFVSGLKEWGVGVSVYDADLKHVQSMILLPELNECIISGQSISRHCKSRICGLPSYMTAAHFNSLSSEYEYRITGCCMYNMFNVITGSFVRFSHLTGCYSWDILPGLNIALENGLSVMVEGNAYQGQFLLPGKKYHFEVYARQDTLD